VTKMRAEEKPTSISGIIVPIDWDEKGNIVAAAISCQDEVEYRIDNNQKGMELLSLVREEVEAVGIIRENGDRKVITVTEYQIGKSIESLMIFLD
jgi:hypothetical protein